MKIFLFRYRWILAFAALAFLIRLPLLWHPSNVINHEFFRDYYMVDHLASGHWPLFGPPSMQTGFRFGPAYYYLMAPLFWLLARQPFSLLLTNIILYAGAAGVCYKLLRLWFNDRYGAILGALFFSVSIYGLHLSSFVSNPNFLPLFVVLCLFFTTKIWQSHPGLWQYALLGACFGFAAQLHITAAIVLPLLMFWPLLQTARQQTKTNNWQNFLSLAAGCFIVSLPYSIYLAQHNFYSIKILLGFSGGHVHGGNLNLAASALANFFSAGLNPFNPRIDYAFIQPNWLYLIIAGVIIASGSMIIYKLLAKKFKNSSPILSTSGRYFIWSWPLAAIIMISLFSGNLHDHYLIILWPYPAVLFAYCGQWFKNKFNVTATFLVIFAVIWSLQAYSLLSRPGGTWETVIPAYRAEYQNNPATPNIGFSQ